jgi:2-oxoglutarate dehydrogenase complex dehydrogenase (E1) component-like enzyme
MYKQVSKMTPVARIYEKELMDTGVIDQAGIEKMKNVIKDRLEAAYGKSKNLAYDREDWSTKDWADIKEVD